MAQRDHRVQMMAKALYRDMTANGFKKTDVVALATALLDQLHTPASDQSTTAD